MKSDDAIEWMNASDMVELTTTGQLTVVQIAAAMIERINAVNGMVNAVVDFDPEQLMRDAKALDQKLQSGSSLGALFGVPYTIKDVTAVKGRKLTGGMKPRKDNVADHDAVIVRRLREADGLFLGKTNTPEAAYYGVTDNHLYGPTHNPWKHGYNAGGSSGGAAAAVVSGIGPLAEGSDGAGSVRIPSAMCGAVGFKPSMGLVPQTLSAVRFNEWAYHGPITRTVADNALMLDVISGPDSSDPMTFPATGRTFSTEVTKNISGLRIAWSDNLNLGEVDEEVRTIARDAAYALTAAGATVTDDTPHWGNPEEAMWHRMWVYSKASMYDQADWRSLRGEVDDQLIDLVLEVEELSAIDIGRANTYRGQMWDTFDRFMQDYEILASPTLSTATFPLGQFAPDYLRDKPLRSQLLGWFFTYPFNMLTTPAISIPAGFTSDGRPVGLQLAGRHHADGMVLRVAAAFERLRPWAHKHPQLVEAGTS